MQFLFRKGWLALALLLASARPCQAYSVLTHEAIIDALWEPSIKPLLRKNFPAATEQELIAAHGFAYGGALMPDMGYFPFGSPFFTNLLHYVRSGDFVTTLLADARSLNEYAFALGTLSHYNADRYGHSLGTNRVVPLVYPETKKFGTVVTYEEDPLAHKRVEFGFDVLQTARGNYASEAYHDFIGFHFADTLLRAVFQKVYGLPLDDLFGNFERAVNTLRWSVKSLFPVLTRAAWRAKRADIEKARPGATARNFRYKMSRKAYQRAFGTETNKPGIFTSMLSGLIRVLPKVGPLKALKFKGPDAKAEKLFIESFDTVSAHYAVQLASLRTGSVVLANTDYDTGNKTEPGEYALADQTFRCLLLNLQKEGFTAVPGSLSQSLLQFFQVERPIPKTAKKRAEAARVAAALATLRAR
ncbi:MAG: hypothetical protein JWP27_2332 [Flaviaesturariibacter sp.]|nr:hypothetical protein [Flaviaesturariibacter sp.]